MAQFDFKKEFPGAFPALDKKQMDSVAEFAECKTYHDGERLFQAGETDFKFHVIKARLTLLTVHRAKRRRF